MTPEPITQIERKALAEKWREIERLMNQISALLGAAEAQQVPDALFDLISTKPLAWCRLIRAMTVIVLSQCEVNARDRLTAATKQNQTTPRKKIEPLNEKYWETIIKNEKFLRIKMQELKILARTITVPPGDPIPVFTFNGKTLSEEQGCLIGASVAYTLHQIYLKHGPENQS